jgi:hypothetical protein
VITRRAWLRWVVGAVLVWLSTALWREVRQIRQTLARGEQIHLPKAERPIRESRPGQ